MSIKPKLNRFDLTMIVISLVIGMGIFATPSEVAIKAGNTWIFFGAWIFGGLVSLCGALTFAEIGARFPATGGFYKVFSYCYHPAIAFMINWVLVISNAASVAAVALIGSDYIRPFLLPSNLQNDTGTKIITITSVMILYVINFLGIKMSARTQSVLIIFKMSMIILICSTVFKSDAIPVHMNAVPHLGSMITAFGLSLVAVFFTYGGYQQTINFGGDIINAKTNIPKAITFGIITVIILYLSINYAYFHILGIGGLQQTPALAAKMVSVIFGPTGYKITSIMIFLSVLAYVNVNVLANPRVYYAMAEDGILPPVFKKVNPKTQVQEFGMSFFIAAIIIILFFVAKFSEMLKYVMFFDTIGLSLAAAAIFLLRKKTKHLDGTGIYTIKWFPLVPVIFIISYWFVTINIFITFRENPYAALICLAAYGVGLIIYYSCTYKKIRRHQRHNMELSYILNELGEERENYFNAVSPPIIQTSNFTFKTVSDFRQALANEYDAMLYSRGNNPTLTILRKKLAALDGAEDALVFSSGIAAVSVPILALLSQGDHAVVVENPYSWTIKLFNNFLPKFGISATFVDGTEVQNIEKAIQPNTKLIYLESPNTFSYELQDLQAVSRIAKSKGILTMIDNSYCGPLYQQPIKLGIDLVAQSATKYLGGHSDIVAGVLTGSKEILTNIFNNEFMNIGPSLSPHSAWLLIRGLRTLPLRMQRSFETAKTITAWLQQHPVVDEVLWPFAPGFKQAELAQQQMQGCGSMFSFTLKDPSIQKIETFCDKLQHILMAVSWGGHESLIIPSIAGFAKEDYDAGNSRHQLIRMYAGLEDADYLIKDLQQALEVIG